MKIMKSKVVALVVAFMMVFSLVAVPVSAADDAVATTVVTSDDAAKFLSEKNLLQGDDNGDLMLGNELTREQMMVIISRLLGVEDEAQNYSTEEMTFKDVPTDNGYAPYVAWAQAEGITQGHSEEEFGFNEALTAWQTKAFFVRALGYVDTTDEEMDAKADELGINAGSDVESDAAILRGEMAVLMYNTLHAKNAEGVVLGEAIGVLEPAVVNAKEVKEVKMVNDTTMKVVFDGPVADTAAAKFEVTGASVVTPTITWNTEKTEATLVAGTVILEGVYTVKVTGLELTKDNAVINVVKNGIAKIEIVAGKMVRVNDYQGLFQFKLTDSYGNDVTEKMSYDVTINTSRGTAAIDDYKTGKVLFTLTDVAPLGSRLAGSDEYWKNSPVTPELITATVYSKTAINGTIATANAVLQVTDVARVDKVEFGAVTFPTTTPATTKVLAHKTTACYIPFVAKDQFGNVVDEEALLSTSNSADVFYAVSDSQVTLSVEKYTDNAGKEGLRLAVNTYALNDTLANRKVTIQAISKYTGSQSNLVTLDIKKSSAPEKVTLLAPEKIVAEGDTYKEALVIPMVVVDEDGNRLTTDEIVDNVDKFILSSSDSNIYNTPTTNLKIATTGANKGKLVATMVGVSKGTKNVMVSVKNSTVGSVSSMTFEVREIAKARTIRLAKTPATNLMFGSKAKYGYEFVDQYGRVMENAMIDAANQVVDVTLTNNYVSATANSVALSSTKVTYDAEDLDGDDVVEVTGGAAAGTSRIKAELHDGNVSTGVVSSVDTSFAVTEGAPTSLAFEIAEIPTIKMLAKAESTYAGLDLLEPYAKALVISGRDSSGNTYTIPYDRILSVSSSDTKVVRIDKVPLTDSSVEDNQNAVVVWGSDEWTETDSTSATKTATITVVVGTDNEAKNITKTVTVSREDSKVKEVGFYTAGTDAVDTLGEVNALLAAEPYEVPSDLEVAEEIYATATTLQDAKFFILTKDQYGVYAFAKDNSGTDIKLTVVNTDKTNVREILYNNADDLTLQDGIFNASNIKANTAVLLMYSVDGSYKTIGVKSSTGVEAVDFVAPTATITADLSALTVTVTFSEDVSKSAASVVDLTATELVLTDGEADPKTLTAGVVASVDDKTYTIAFTNGAAAAALVTGDDVTVTFSGIYDKAGNAMTQTTATTQLVD